MNAAQLKTLRNKAMKQSQAMNTATSIIQGALDVINEEIADLSRVRDGLKAVMKAPKRPRKAPQTPSAALHTRPAWERAHAWLKDHPGSSAHEVALSVDSTKNASHSLMIRLQEKGLARRRKKGGKVLFWAK